MRGRSRRTEGAQDTEAGVGPSPRKVRQAGGERLVQVVNGDGVRPSQQAVLACELADCQRHLRVGACTCVRARVRMCLLVCVASGM